MRTTTPWIGHTVRAERVHLSHLLITTGWTGPLHAFLDHFAQTHALADDLKLTVGMQLPRPV